MRIYVGSLGCKLNQAEMEDLATRLAGTGHRVVASPGEADLCVFNTCAVTHVAAQKSRQALRRLHRDNPKARLVVTGCYAELSPGDLAGLPGIKLVAGNEQKEGLAALLAGQGGLMAGQEAMPAPDGSSDLPPSRTRALVKIQDGCDNACTYCIIHVARGPQRSRSPEQVLAEVQARLAAGHREIVLTGVHIGAYGRDAAGPGLVGPSDLWALVGHILAETSVERLRLSSIEPWDLPAQALDLWHDRRLCRHLHLPLQSGHDATLARMGRHYTTADFAALVARARAAIPGLAVTTDLIVGFPGETEEAHGRTLAFLEEMAFARVHVFPYSLREGTPAAAMPGQVPAQVKAGRARAARAVAARSSRAFRRQFLGQTVQVLWESCRPEGQGLLWSGLTDNYLRVRAPGGEGLSNTLGRVRLLDLGPGGLRGEMEDQKGGG
ncbi:MAG: tRNA (N(6)-L-threonylcarbamoyladenosine(37)-C(2))-methylthiotransferase MtaB [Anaerolineae bacterium]|jgi:threonylcarbamoyladenosine tRNA methylthiotransferase MtaB